MLRFQINAVHHLIQLKLIFCLLLLYLTLALINLFVLVWQDGSSTPDFNVSVPGTYFLSASNHCGFSSDTIDVRFETPPADFNLGSDTILCPGHMGRTF